MDTLFDLNPPNEVFKALARPEPVQRLARKGYQIWANFEGFAVATYVEATSLEHLRQRISEEFPADEGYTDPDFKEIS